MFDSVTLTPKQPADAAIDWLKTWKPDKDARLHMKTGSPIWTHAIPDVFAANGIDVAPWKAGLVKRIMEDAVARYGYADLGTPDFAKLECLKSDWPSTWPDDPKKYRFAPQETTLDPLVWCFKQGIVQAGHMAAIEFMSYYNSKAWSYLRTGGDTKMPYMDRGRARTARGCLAYCRGMLEILEAAGVTGGPLHAFVKALLNEHVRRIRSKWPLVDQPAGDHLPVQFVCVYQVATLYTEMARCEPWLGEHEMGDAGWVMGWVVNDMLPIARIDDQHYYYDVAMTDKDGFYKYPQLIGEMEANVTTVAGVGQWLATLPGTRRLLDHARELGWAKTQPQLLAQHWGCVS